MEDSDVVWPKWGGRKYLPTPLQQITDSEDELGGVVPAMHLKVPPMGLLVRTVATPIGDSSGEPTSLATPPRPGNPPKAAPRGRGRPSRSASRGRGRPPKASTLHGTRAVDGRATRQSRPRGRGPGQGQQCTIEPENPVA
jgi:hypothetical protein